MNYEKSCNPAQTEGEKKKISRLVTKHHIVILTQKKNKLLVKLFLVPFHLQGDG